MAERLHFHFSLSCIGEGNGNPLQCSCLENPRDGGAWWAAVYGIAQSQTWLKRLSSSSSSNLKRNINIKSLFWLYVLWQSYFLKLHGSQKRLNFLPQKLFSKKKKNQVKQILLIAPKKYLSLLCHSSLQRKLSINLQRYLIS